MLYHPDLVLSPVTDQYGRTFKTLRVSLTNSCNFGCLYCVEADGETTIEAPSEYKPLSSSNLSEVIEKLHEMLQLEAIRLTGGEPTLYTGIVKLVERISLLGIPVKMTTNGFLLKRFAKPLREAGLQSINVSLDAVEQEAFEKITKRKGLAQVLDGIEAALAQGIDVKLNTVVMKGVNDHQVLPLFEYARSQNIVIRYLELMRMGHLFSAQFDQYFFSQDQILELVSKQHAFVRQERGNSSTASYWQTPEGASFGIIANESEPFCHDCNRLRLDSSGNVYGCLSENRSVNLINNLGNKEHLMADLQKALAHKQDLAFKGSPLTMIGIGG